MLGVKKANWEFNYWKYAQDRVCSKVNILIMHTHAYIHRYTETFIQAANCLQYPFSPSPLLRKLLVSWA